MKKLDPRAVWLFFLQGLLTLFIVFIFIGVQIAMVILEIGKMGGAAWAFLTFLLIMVFLIFLLFFWAKLSYHFYKYELTEDGFRKELGVIWKKYVTIPYDRIQNVDIYRGVFARLLGLSDLNIQTAGYSAAYRGTKNRSEGRLPGVSKEEAEKLRDELIKRAKHSKNQGL